MGQGAIYCKKKTIQEELNILADTLAGDYASCLDPKFVPESMPLDRPGYKFCLLHNGSTVMAKLHQTLLQAKHSLSLQQHIMKKANWPHTYPESMDIHCKDDSSSYEYQQTK
jgi:hypothetical protein